MKYLNFYNGGRALRIAFGITMLVLLVAGGAGAAMPISACITISSAGTYVLTQSIVNSTNSICINITSNNVVFDGSGYTIDGVKATSTLGNTQGVYVYNSATALTNVTVKNLIAKDWGSGIYYNNINNGSITNNVASNNSYGIDLVFSSNNTLSNNNASNNSFFGIYLDSSSNNTLSNNIIRSNNASNNNGDGILLDSSSNNNTLSSNNASNNNNYGIEIQSSNNTLTNNTMTGNEYNFIVANEAFAAQSVANSNIDISNTVDGKPVYYIKNGADAVYDSSSNAGTIYCLWCNNVTFKNLTLTKNGFGIFLWKTNSSKVIGVNASKNDAGISLGSSNNNTLTDNNVSNNIYGGIQLSDFSNNNTLSNNNASNTAQFCPGFFSSISCIGISLYFYSNNNTLSNNNVLNNNFGITLDFSSNNTLSNNNVSNNNK
jgi:parallel beta-helix repeat protein